MAELNKLCIHQVTLLEQCDFRQSIECLARHEVPATAVWRDKLAAVGVREAARILADHDIKVTALCAGGFVTSADADAALEDNRRWLEQAAAIGAPSMVTITGGFDPGDKDLARARGRALEGLTRLIPEARAAGVKLALEPLHPMVCGLRAVISTMREANDWLDQLAADDVMRIALDSYAVWWEPDLSAEIRRAGARIDAFHVSDWLPDTCDVRLDRGMPGDGVIDLPGMRADLEAAGYEGYYEVEIFSARNWWRRDPDDVVKIIKERLQTAV